MKWENMLSWLNMVKAKIMIQASSSDDFVGDFESFLSRITSD